MKNFRMGSWARITLKTFAVAGAGLWACSGSGPTADAPLAPVQEGEIIDGPDGGVPSDMSMPNSTEIEGTEPTVPANYWPLGFDLGEVDPNEQFRALIQLQLRNQAELVSRIDSIYTPGSSQFRKYLSVGEFLERYAPTEATVGAVTSWLTSQGFKIERTAKNRLLINYSGTVGQFNAAFGTNLRLVRRTETTWRAPAFAPLQSIEVPQALIGKIRRLLLPDPAAEVGTLRRDITPIDTTLPPDVKTKLAPQQIAKAYGLSTLYAQGFRGAGMTIGIVGATLFKVSDAQSMWQTFGITRANPVVIETMEPIITRDLETTLDIQLAGAVAPEAEIVYYGGPNNADTTLLYTFNEAIADNRAQVISDSFAHAEASTPYSVSHAYNESALMAAALGITVLSAAGNSNQVDVPSNSPYVTSVGGTNVELNADGTWKSERSWGLSGCGLSRLFSTPAWQLGEYGATKGRRALTDVSTVVGPYWVKYLATWTYADGTSAATPVFAGVLTLVNQHRKAQGKPPVGFVNPIIYKHPATCAAFRDITAMGWGGCEPTPGYDLATGIGTPKVPELAIAIP